MLRLKQLVDQERVALFANLRRYSVSKLVATRHFWQTTSYTRKTIGRMNACIAGASIAEPNPTAPRTFKFACDIL